MTNPSRRLVPATVIAVATLGLLAACGDTEDGSAAGPDRPAEPSTSAAPTETASTPGAECADVIPAAVVEGLGWAAKDPAVEDRGGCVWEGPEGTIYVQQSADTLEEACDRLRGAAEDTTFRARIDNPVGAAACGYVRTTDLGLSELAVDLDGQVVSINVGALQPTGPDQVRASLLALTESAARLS